MAGPVADTGPSQTATCLLLSVARLLATSCPTLTTAKAPGQEAARQPNGCDRIAEWPPETDFCGQEMHSKSLALRHDRKLHEVEVQQKSDLTNQGGTAGQAS